jgi:hypothetical protein
MSGWDWFGLVMAVMAIVAAACWATYSMTAANSFSCGYQAGREAERQTDRVQLHRVLRQSLEQGLITQASLDRLYAQAMRRITQGHRATERLVGGKRP